MKNVIFIIICLMTSILNAQISKLSHNEKNFKNLENKYSNQQIELFIREVFLEHANELVIENNDSIRLAFILDFTFSISLNFQARSLICYQLSN